MRIEPRHLIVAVVVTAVSAVLAVGSTGAATVLHVGMVEHVDPTGTFVVGDMGPKLPSGESKVTRYTVRVTPSTEMSRVSRAAGVAPSGWIGGYVEVREPSLRLKPGDWVVVTADDTGQGVLTATKITVVEVGTR